MPAVAERPSPVSAAQKADYERDGFLVVRGVFSPVEMAVAAMEADRLYGRDDLKDTNNIRCRWKDHAATGACLFECFDPVNDISPVCDQIARDPRLVDIVSALYGEPARLFKDKLIFKPPGAHGYDLHQDYIGWPGFPKSFVTAAVAVDPCAKDNGATEVFPGYHQRGYLSPEDGDYHPMPAGVVDETAGVVLELEPGDVAFFGCFVPHQSAANRSAGWRRLLYLSYNADSDGGDRRTAHYDEFHAWLKTKYGEYGKHNTYFR
ncbi:MAG TPA: phytanoyl-CoA dioxygenase family protein [Urbifossiella sp.]|jgi:ectoine hydroxylase-related dioxygenase (phytanoyl-CoA dioxygenase family)|nr:phytanoyl-CoA dioxygenase family protein [Urbifossiella sp.]